MKIISKTTSLAAKSSLLWYDIIYLRGYRFGFLVPRNNNFSKKKNNNSCQEARATPQKLPRSSAFPPQDHSWRQPMLTQFGRTFCDWET